MRPGRFDEIVEMPLPSVADIAGILRAHLKGALPAEELFRIAHEVTGLTPAAIDAGLRRAKSEARHMSADMSGDLIRACLGLAETDTSLLQRIAIHEIGHAITARLLTGRPVIRVAIFSQGGCTERPLRISHQTRAPNSMMS
ncbi:hypothetical protein JMM62_17655 [Rhodovulum sulfidophilum]|nr:hypothetical protein [Rhodovulum sulfidophilum]